MMAIDPDTAGRVVLGLMIVAAAAIGIPFRLRADRAGGPVSRRSDPRWFWVGMSIVGPPLAITCVAFLIRPRWVDFTRIEFPLWVRWLGVPLALSGIALFGWMFRHLGLNVTSTAMPRAKATLVTSGPYRWIRHPMYSAALLLVMASTFLTANLVVASAGLIMFVLLAARSRLEEQRLVEKFGDAYREYQRQTGRFVPRPGGG
jgi:protein-S-isoprenylcysteine O-methyltransferase Ste14